MASADQGLVSRSDVLGTSLMVQWLRLCASNARGEGLDPGWGSKIPLVSQHDSKQTKKVTRVTSRLELTVSARPPELSDEMVMAPSASIPE